MEESSSPRQTVTWRSSDQRKASTLSPRLIGDERPKTNDSERDRAIESWLQRHEEQTHNEAYDAYYRSNDYYSVEPNEMGLYTCPYMSEGCKSDLSILKYNYK